MVFRTAVRFLVFTVLGVGLLSHASVASAASPCLPYSSYLSMLMREGGDGPTTQMWQIPDADFNGDGCADLAIGVSYEDIDSNTKQDGGAVNILYGLTSGLTVAGDQIWDQEEAGIAGAPEADDRFGAALTAGDFNGDGITDLAVGVPFEDIDNNTKDDGGAVNVIYGTSSGLSAAGDQIWDQSTDGIAGAPETSDYFGYALAAGDFDGDGYDDLAIGVPLEDIDNNTKDNGGAVNVIYGSASGLTAAGNQIWDQGTDGVAGAPENSDLFGSSLSAGDFNGDGYVDLAIGVPFEDIDNNTKQDGGAVNILYGSASGLTASGDQIWDQSTDGIAGAPEVNDRFGSSLAAGDFNGDGYADLSIGVPLEDIDNNSKDNGGTVNVIYGSPSGLAVAGNQIWDQANDAIAGAPESNDQFGTSLIAGDFNGDGYADLAIGVPLEDIDSNTKINGGAVNILYGSAAGLTPTGNQIWDQSTDGIAGAPESGDQFGYSLAAGDYNSDGYADLAIGVPLEDIDSNTKINGGAVNILYGSAAGISAAGNQIWDQSTDGVEGAPEDDDRFGVDLR